MKWFQGCALIFFLVVLSIPVYVIGSNLHARREMDEMNRTIASVAREFGYTPARYLYYERGFYDASIVTGASRCGSELYFVTPLDVSGFRARMDALVPRTMHDEWERFSTTVPWPNGDLRGLTLNGLTDKEARALKLNGENHYYEVPRFRRGSIRDTFGVDVWLENTAILTGTLTLDGRAIQGNIIQIRGNNGPYPIWVPCRATNSYKPLPPFSP